VHGDAAAKVFAFSQPALFGELAIMLWLLIKGAHSPTPPPLVNTA